MYIFREGSAVKESKFKIIANTTKYARKFYWYRYMLVSFWSFSNLPSATNWLGWNLRWVS